MDNLNTHVGASLYKTFAPEEARRILNKLEFHYTPNAFYLQKQAHFSLQTLAVKAFDPIIKISQACL